HGQLPRHLRRTLVDAGAGGHGVAGLLRPPVRLRRHLLQLPVRPGDRGQDLGRRVPARAGRSGRPRQRLQVQRGGAAVGRRARRLALHGGRAGEGAAGGGRRGRHEGGRAVGCQRL
ncbi:hypothetical protein LTR39_006278, partial [Cryomyces antarcticus]